MVEIHITKTPESWSKNQPHADQQTRQRSTFAEAYAGPKNRATPHSERCAEAIRRAFAGDYKALRDQLLVHDESSARCSLPEARILVEMQRSA